MERSRRDVVRTIGARATAPAAALAAFASLAACSFPSVAVPPRAGVPGIERAPNDRFTQDASCAPAPAPSPGGTSAYATCDFTVKGRAVEGSGTTGAGDSDHFFAAAGSTENINIDAGARLTARCDNTSSATSETSCGSSSNELVFMARGALVNRGTLESYPSEPEPGVNYALTDNIVAVENPSEKPAEIENYGIIGNENGPGGFYGPHGYYGQGSASGMLIAGQAEVTNEAGAYLAGYNAFFTTSGSGTFDNFGTVFGVNDGALTGYVTTNHEDAGLLTGIQGYACIHEYGTFVNDGYVLGSDFGVLMASGDFTDEGGPRVPGKKDVTGKPVYNGEVEAITRGSSGPEPNPTPAGTAVKSGAAIEMDGDGLTVTLQARRVDGTFYLPYVGGPIEGGFNGTEANGNAKNANNVVDFDFRGLAAAQAEAFEAALTHSKQTNALGSFYTGTSTIEENGIAYTYQWDNVAKLEFSGKPIP